MRALRLGLALGGLASLVACSSDPRLPRPAGSGDGGVILAFAPGTSPSAQSSGTDQQLNGVAFGDYGDGGGIFAAVGSSGTVLTSPDGATWTAQSSGVGGNLYNVTWGNGGFIATGEDGVLLGSADGTTWSVPDGIGDLGLAPIIGATYANGRYVAVGNNQVVTSTDGATWSALPTETRGITGITVDLFQVTYGNGKFVTVGTYNTSTDDREIAYDGLIATSTDGASWQIQQPYPPNYLSGVVYGGSQFVAVGRGGLLLTSPDGTTWTAQTVRGLDASKTPYLINVAYANGQYLVVGNFVGVNPSTGFFLTSPDGEHWSYQDMPANLYGVAYGRGVFVLVGGQ